MSTPQQPWSPGQPAPTDQPAPQGYGVPLGYGSPQAPDAGQGYGSAPQHGGQQPYGTQQPYGAGQPYGAAQPYGRPQTQPQPYAGPTGELVLNLRKPFGAMGMIAPVVVVDGRPVGASWGRNAWQVPAGVRQVDVAQSYMWTYGRASQPVNVAPGATSEIFYSGPMATFGFGGAMGTEPQRRPGTGLFIGLMVFLLLLVVLVVVSVTVGNS